MYLGTSEWMASYLQTSAKRARAGILDFNTFNIFIELSIDDAYSLPCDYIQMQSEVVEEIIYGLESGVLFGYFVFEVAYMFVLLVKYNPLHFIFGQPIFGLKSPPYLQAQWPSTLSKVSYWNKVIEIIYIFPTSATRIESPLNEDIIAHE